MSTMAHYNGITLQKVLTQELMYEPTLDGPNYVRTRQVLALRGVLSPSESSYTRNNQGTLTNQPGNLGAETLRSIEHQISQPRGRFILAVGGTTVISAPELDEPCDADNGPKVHHVRAYEVFGERTVLVEMVIEVNVNRCLPKNKQHIVLSNVWRMDESIALPNYLSERSVSGHMILHPGRARAANLHPDHFRRVLSHPRPAGYQRDNIAVRADESGYRLDYSFTDHQLPINYGPFANNISKVEAVHHVASSRPQLDEVLSKLMYSAGRTIGTIARSSFSPQGVVGAGLAVGFGAIDLGLTYLNMIPRNKHTITVRVYGNKNSTKSALQTTAANIALASMVNVPTFGSVWGGFGVAVMYDLMGKMVEYQMVWESGLDRVFNAAISTIINGGANNNAQVNFNVENNPLVLGAQNVVDRLRQLAGQTRAVNVDTPNGGAEDVRIDPAPGEPGFPAKLLINNPLDADVRNPEAPLSSGLRSRAELILAQSLQEECALPAREPEPATIRFAGQNEIGAFR